MKMRSTLQTAKQTLEKGLTYAWEESSDQKMLGINLAGRPKSVTLKIGKQRFRSLIDTGAEVSLMHNRVFRTLKGQKVETKDIVLQSANGGLLGVVGKTELKFQLGDKTSTHSFVVVSDLNRNLILGNDWLEKNGEIIYFNLMKLRVGSTYIPLEEDIHICSLVRATRDVVLPPQTARVCEVSLKDRPYFDRDSYFEIAPAEQGFIAEGLGLQVYSSGVQVSKQRRYPVLIANSTNKTYKIRRGCVVGKMEPVKQMRSVNIGEVSREETHKQDPLNEEDVKAPSDMKGETVQLVRENSDLFANSDLDLSQTDTGRMKLDTGGEPPIHLSKTLQTPAE